METVLTVSAVKERKTVETVFRLSFSFVHQAKAW
jgi:hypothetical protein